MIQFKNGQKTWQTLCKKIHRNRQLENVKVMNIISHQEMQIEISTVSHLVAGLKTPDNMKFINIGSLIITKLLY